MIFSKKKHHAYNKIRPLFSRNFLQKNILWPGFDSVLKENWYEKFVRHIIFPCNNQCLNLLLLLNQTVLPTKFEISKLKMLTCTSFQSKCPAHKNRNIQFKNVLTSYDLGNCAGIQEAICKYILCGRTLWVFPHVTYSWFSKNIHFPVLFSPDFHLIALHEVSAADFILNVSYCRYM